MALQCSRSGLCLFFGRSFTGMAGNLAWGGRETTTQYTSSTGQAIPTGTVYLRDLKIRRIALCNEQVSALFPLDTKDIALQDVNCTAPAAPAPPAFNVHFVRIQQPTLQVAMVLAGIAPTQPYDGRLFFASISAATAFSGNDMIMVGPGTYVDAVGSAHVGTKTSFSIISEQGQGSTFWECPAGTTILLSLTVNSVNALVRGITIRKCNNRVDQPVIQVVSATLTMESCTLANISNPVGVSAMLVRLSTLTMRDCTAVNVLGPVPGFIFRFSAVTIENSRFLDSGNNAVVAVYFGLFDIRQQNSIVFSNTSITNCATSGQPVILMALRDVTDVAGPSMITFTNGCAIRQNKAISAAAFIHSEKGNATFVNSFLEDNSAGDHVILYFAKDTVLSFYNSTIRRNSAGRSGPIQVREQSTLIVRSSSFTNNTARANGGAIYAQEGAVISMQDSVCANNMAGNLGGCFHADTSVSLAILRSTFTNNKATSGGAISLMDGASATLTSCTIDKNNVLDVGGAVVLQGRAIFNATSTVIVNNVARHDAGAILANIVTGVPSIANVALTDSVLSNNTCSDSSGALFAKGQAVVLFRRTRVEFNVAKVNGGAARISDQCIALFDRTVFAHNTASVSGGALYLDTASLTTTTNSSFESNKAAFGGAVAITMLQEITAGAFIASSTAFKNNEAKTSGGAISQDNGYLTLTNATFTENIANRPDIETAVLAVQTVAEQDGGGAVYSTLSSVFSFFTASNSSFIDNTANRGVGGAVLLYHSPGAVRAVFTHCVLTGNLAAMGASLHIENPRAPAISLVGSVVEGNVAQLAGVNGDRPTTGIHSVSFSLASAPVVYSGQTLSGFSAATFDAYGPSFSDGDLFQVALIRAGGDFALFKLHGDTLKASTRGNVQFSDLNVHGIPGDYILSVNLLADPSVSSQVGVTVLPCPDDKNHAVENDSDGVPVCHAFRTNYERNQGLLIAVAVLCGLGICMALSFYGALLYFHDDRIVKASQPRFLYVLVLGALVAYVGLILDMPSPTDSYCIAQNWLWHISFALIYTPLFTKTWRVKKIFTNKDLTLKLNLSDRHLMLFVGASLAAVCIVLAVWTGLRPQFVQVVDDATNPLLQYSECSVNIGWTAITWAVEGIFVLWGCILAYETRSIPDNFNESRFLAFAVWNYFVINMVVLPISLVITHNPNAQFVLRSLSLFLTPTMVLCVYFIPRFSSILGERLVKQDIDVSEVRYMGTSKQGRNTSVSSMGRTYSTSSDKQATSESRDSGIGNGSANGHAKKADDIEIHQVTSIAVDIIPEVDDES
eukprot:Opistho-2@32048